MTIFKRSIFSWAIVCVTVVSISLAGLTGCKSLELMSKEAENKEKPVVNAVSTVDLNITIYFYQLIMILKQKILFVYIF